jgi:hypothetical protein
MPEKGASIMMMYRSCAWSMFCILAWANSAAAGWVIDQVIKGGGQGDEDKQQVIMQANQMKTVMLGSDGKPETAFILDLNAETFTQVNYREGSYMTAKVQEYAQMLSGGMKDAMSAMKEALKDVPPEQRQMMEQMMRSKMPQGDDKPGDCREPKIETRKTGRQATIAGYSAVAYEILADGKPDSELWIAKGIAAGKELDPKKLERVMGEFMKAVPRCGPAAGPPGSRRPGIGQDQAWKLASEGYPVKTIMRGGSGATVEVVKADSRSVPASEFQPPANFTRQTLKEMMGR